MTRIVEKIEWLRCNRCGESLKLNDPKTTGWLNLSVIPIGIVVAQIEEKHLCTQCVPAYNAFMHPHDI